MRNENDLHMKTRGKRTARGEHPNVPASVACGFAVPMQTGGKSPHANLKVHLDFYAPAAYIMQASLRMRRPRPRNAHQHKNPGYSQ